MSSLIEDIALLSLFEDISSLSSFEDGDSMSTKLHGHPFADGPTVDPALQAARSITNWTKLGAAIRDARVTRGLTQAEAAANAGVARSWLARVEAGHRGAELETLLKLFASLGLEMAIGPAVRPSDEDRPFTRRELQQRERELELHAANQAGASNG